MKAIPSFVQAYQRDLFMLKYLTTQTFFDLSKSSLSSVSTGTKEAVDITVEVGDFGKIWWEKEIDKWSHLKGIEPSIFSLTDLDSINQTI